VLIDGTVLVDYGPDVYGQIRMLGRDLTGVTTLLFTHHHDDHLTPSELQYRGPWFVTETPPSELTILGNETVVEKLNAAFATMPLEGTGLHLSVAPPLQPFVEIETPDGTRVLPLPADHAPKAMVLRIERGGKRLFYGHDSGLYPQVTVDALRGTPLDGAIFDCTLAFNKTSNEGHMGIDGVLKSVERLREAGVVTTRTTLIATHFSHNGQALHAELTKALEPNGVIVAYDGLELEI
jgi:phosphoribosyl 1,2-cyclic phosphate phosphodiesterase